MFLLCSNCLSISILFPMLLAYLTITCFSMASFSHVLPDLSQFIIYLSNYAPIFLLIVGRIPSYWSMFDVFSYCYYDLVLLIQAKQWLWRYSFIPSFSCIVSSVTTNVVCDCFCCIVLPSLSNILLRFDSLDVIHCFGVPFMGFKVDCLPGKSCDFLICCSFGYYYGACYEYCGAHHSYIPVFLVFL